MNRLATITQSPLHLIKQYFQNYLFVFKQIWFFVILSTLINAAAPYFLKDNDWMTKALVAVYLIITWYLYAASLLRANSTLRGESLGVFATLANVGKRFGFILLGNIIFTASMVLIFLFVSEVISILLAKHLAPLAVLIICAAMLIFLLLYIFYAVPLVVIENSNPFYAFEESFLLVAGNWMRTFFALSIVLIFMVLLFFVGRLLVIFGGTSTIITIVSSICQFLFYPFVIVATLISLNDLILRKKR